MERKIIFKNYFGTACVLLTGRFLYVKWHLLNKQTNQPNLKPKYLSEAVPNDDREGLWMMNTL